MSFSARHLRMPLCFLLTALGGCALLPAPWFAEEQRYSGLLLVAEGLSTLEPCDGSELRVLEQTDRLEALFNQVAQPGQTAIFVDLLGVEGTDQRLRVGDVIRMQSSGRGCADSAYVTQRWIAQGDSPDWRAELGSAGLQRVDQSVATATPLPVISEELPDVALSYRSLRGMALELLIYPQPCFSASSGDYFHRTAVLMQEGTRLAGCAYRGLQP
ncbi:MAG: hypothetical protein CVV07_01395 [Gammaproteobacteria bacterium HGW-Gammaproteobacteria-11]|nr:MAG: hypothetical protein CVV07_01395 [Gammaproteobacteria bacterium HGW-Gammaproteobacteria-11]